MLELVKFPSTIGVNGWTQAWIPLFADVKYRNYILSTEDWKLGKADFELADEMATLSDANSSSDWTTHTFRTPITVNSGRNLAAKIKEFREEFIGMGRLDKRAESARKYSSESGHGERRLRFESRRSN